MSIDGFLPTWNNITSSCYRTPSLALSWSAFFIKTWMKTSPLSHVLKTQNGKNIANVIDDRIKIQSYLGQAGMWGPKPS